MVLHVHVHVQVRVAYAPRIDFSPPEKSSVTIHSEGSRNTRYALCVRARVRTGRLPCRDAVLARLPPCVVGSKQNPLNRCRRGHETFAGRAKVG